MPYVYNYLRLIRYQFLAQPRQMIIFELMCGVELIDSIWETRATELEWIPTFAILIMKVQWSFASGEVTVTRVGTGADRTEMSIRPKGEKRDFIYFKFSEVCTSEVSLFPLMRPDRTQKFCPIPPLAFCQQSYLLKFRWK
jgi:hypothetical protein